MYIYVAGPYTKGDVILNIRDAVYVGDTLRSMGHIPFIPHMTYAWHMIVPHEVDYWYQYDLQWLERCDALYRIAGESTGADREVERARELWLPVFHSISEVQKFTKLMENQ